MTVAEHRRATRLGPTGAVLGGDWGGFAGNRSLHIGIAQDGSSPRGYGSTVRQAADALRRLSFGLRTQEQYGELRSDPERWAEYLSEAETTDVDDVVN